MRLLVGTSLSALALAVSVPVSAQDVVMRRPLPISNQSGNAGWQTSEFRPVDGSGNPVLPQDACGLYTERRDVTCINDRGERVGEYFCASEPKPADSRPQFHDSGCSYSWNETAWNDPGNNCTLTETQTRSVTCRRDLDNAVVNDDKCSAAKPASTQILPDFSTCSHSWKTDAYADNGPSCVLAEVQNRNVWCERDLDGTTVDGMCDAGTRPAGSQTVEDVRACTYSWDEGDWVDPGASCTATETLTRPIICKRDLDDTNAVDSMCDAGTRPSSSMQQEDFSGCSYSRVNPSAWSYASNCSANTSRSRVYQCRRSDGTIVDGSVCAANNVDVNETENGVSEYSSCTNSWATNAWVDPGASCTDAETQTRSVWCKRDLDSAVQVDGACDAGARPAASQVDEDYSGCSYTAVNWTGYTPASTCSANTTQTRTAECRRGDGTIVAGTECTSRGVPVSETQTGIQNYTTCTNSWATGSFVDPGASCTATETQTRSVWCKRDLDSAVQVDGACNAGNRPAASQVGEDYSGCSYTAVNPTAWTFASTCSTNTSKTRTFQCQRGDGTIVDNSECTSRSVALSETVTGETNLTSCGYSAVNPTAWTFASTCSTNTSRTRTFQCQRSDGTIVAGSECTNRSIPLSVTETGLENLTSCGYSAVNPSGWTYASTCSANTSRTQTFQCQRSDGTIVGNGECTSRSIPLSVTQTGQENYTSCSYNGSSSQSSCSNGYQDVNYTCTRSDGVVVANSSCGLPTGTQQAACSSYSWQNGGWSAWSACAGGTQTQTRAVWCQEKTGAATATVSDSFCGGGKPATSQSQSCTNPVPTFSGYIYNADAYINVGGSFNNPGANPSFHQQTDGNTGIDLGNGNGNHDFAGFNCGYAVSITYGGQTGSASSLGYTSENGSCIGGLSTVVIGGRTFNTSLSFSGTGNGTATYIFRIF